MRCTLALLVAAAALPVQPAPASAQNLPPCAVGLRVKGTLNYPGTIVAADAAKDSYQVKMDDGALVWMSGKALGINFSCKSAGAAAPSTAFFIGKWEMFTDSASNRVVVGNTVLRERGVGGRSPPLTVRSDGTFSWQVSAEQTIEGRWRPLADNELRPYTKGPAILLMRGYNNFDWQMWWPQDVRSADNRDQVTLEPSQGGISMMGTRAP
jgi:hypothetical protein